MQIFESVFVLFGEMRRILVLTRFRASAKEQGLGVIGIIFLLVACVVLEMLAPPRTHYAPELLVVLIGLWLAVSLIYKVALVLRVRLFILTPFIIVFSVLAVIAKGVWILISPFDGWRAWVHQEVGLLFILAFIFLDALAIYTASRDMDIRKLIIDILCPSK